MEVDTQEEAAQQRAAEEALYAAEVRREQAENEAQDATNRLRVAQEQLAEWASEKEQDALHLVQLSAAALEQLQNGEGPQERLADLMKLKRRLEESAMEARAFAEQQKADAMKHQKRSIQQAGMGAHEDEEMKRPREESAAEESAPSHDANGEDGVEEPSTAADDVTAPLQGLGSPTNFAERAKYIPMRLDQEQRRLLHLLEAALSVSEYTDKVDILTWRNKSGRIHTQIKDTCAVLCGLVVAQDYKRGQQLVTDRSFADNATFFQTVFEVGRRYKIMNPDKMRSVYGKLLYMLMDSANPEVQELLEFKCVAPLLTVHAFLDARGGTQLLDDPLLDRATAEIQAGDRPRYEVQRDIKAKERAREAIARKYCSSRLSQEDILTAIYSLSDNNSFLLFNRDPIEKFIQYFKACFRPHEGDGPYSLAIQGGRAGARLTHNHERQYHYVLQSLTLWREVSTDMFKLWYLAEQDMLREGNSYRLCDTGQGLNRVQAAPSVSRAMHGILARCQRSIGSWVGSSVVHLGDHNVPNALMFIDKYTQVPRILNPVVMVLDELPKVYRDPELKKYVDATFGSLRDCQMYIITDFCRHAFDGSGADNFFDAGSCIDGRLTSAWNWCSKVEKKPYYPLFKLAGFSGFDGDFK